MEEKFYCHCYGKYYHSYGNSVILLPSPLLYCRILLADDLADYFLAILIYHFQFFFLLKIQFFSLGKIEFLEIKKKTYFDSLFRLAVRFQASVKCFVGLGPQLRKMDQKNTQLGQRPLQPKPIRLVRIREFQPFLYF